jgi:hypothetical protein
MDILDIIKMPENTEKYICKICDFKCSKQSNYKKHIDTPKHIKNSQNDIKKELIEEYICECGKKYNYYSGLWRHKKTCNNSQNNMLEASISEASISEASISAASISDASISGANISDASNNVIQLLINENKELINDNKDFKNMIMELVKSNNDLQKQMIEICKKKIAKEVVIDKS